MLSKALGFCLFLLTIFTSLVHSNAFSILTKPVYELEKVSLRENPETGKQLFCEITSVFEASAEVSKAEVDDVDDDTRNIASQLGYHTKGKLTNTVLSQYFFKHENRKLFILFCSLRIHLV